jgi:hypothetical protein
VTYCGRARGAKDRRRVAVVATAVVTNGARRCGKVINVSEKQKTKWQIDTYSASNLSTQTSILNKKDTKANTSKQNKTEQNKHNQKTAKKRKYMTTGKAKQKKKMTKGEKTYTGTVPRALHEPPSAGNPPCAATAAIDVDKDVDKEEPSGPRCRPPPRVAAWVAKYDSID